jgi:hypothetical protein
MRGAFQSLNRHSLKGGFTLRPCALDSYETATVYLLNVHSAAKNGHRTWSMGGHNLAFRHVGLLVPNDSHYFAVGKVIWKQVFWSSDATVIEPACASTMDLTMASPSPAPSPLR